MTIQALLILRWSLEFPAVARKAFLDRRPVGAVCHILMSRCPVTIHADQAFFMVDAVSEFYDLLFYCVAEIEYVSMTIQASLGCYFVVSKILRGYEMIACLSDQVPVARVKFLNP
jgi:hypothetical protein